MKTLLKTIIFALVLTIGTNANAQQVDIENLGDNFKKENLFKLSGGLNAGLIGFNGNTESTRSPLTWSVNGNISLRVFDLIDLPVSLNLTNANQNLNVPNIPTRISISPTYKGVTLHAGDVNLTYSPYTLNGHQFVGAGVDVMPNNSRLQVRGMYGKLQSAVAFDTNDLSRQPAYERWGYGGKVAWVDDAYELGVSLFSARDRINSLSLEEVTNDFLPEQNAVGSFNFKLSPARWLTFDMEYAISALTSNLRDSSDVAERNTGIFNSIYPVNNSTGYYHARKVNILFQPKKTQIGIGYERIDPGYRSLGVYFFANDLENFTLKLARTLLQNKLSVNATGGLQRDDLNGQKSGQNSRFVGALNLNYTPSQKLILTTSYSNFRTFMRVKNQFQFINQLNEFQALDTFNFSQINQNLNATAIYTVVDKKESSQNLMLNLSAQDAFSERGGEEVAEAASVFYNLGLSHTYLQKNKKWNITTSYFVSQSTAGTAEFLTQGPSIAYNNRIAKERVGINASFNFNQTTSPDVNIPTTNVVNIRVGTSAVIKKKHNVSLSLMQQLRNSTSEQIGNLSYSFNF